MGLSDLTIKDIQSQLKSRELSATDLVKLSLDRVDELEPKLGAFITVDREGALAQASALDASLAAGADLGPLAGVPAGIKDNILTKGVLTTCASKMLANYIPVYSATVVERLTGAGSITIGKTNMDEFAMGSSTEYSAFHPTYNPWGENRVPGGSSGGSAAAVAAGEVTYALGSDTGGSVRQPAALCGVVGFKPSYGLVSRYGLIANASSLDHVGPLTRNVADAAAVMEVLAGHDPRDTMMRNEAVPAYTEALTGDIKGMRIGIAKEYFIDSLDAGVKEQVLAAAKVLEGLGAIVEEVSLPHSEYAIAANYIILAAEATSNLGRFDGIRYGVQAAQPAGLQDLYLRTRSEGFGAEVKRRIAFGNYVLSTGHYEDYFLQAQRVRTLVKGDYDQALGKYDLLLGPTAPTTAFKLADNTHDPLAMYQSDILTVAANLAGLPAISVPCGLVDGLPVGLQLIGRQFADSDVLRAAHAFEQATDHHKLRPQVGQASDSREGGRA